MNSVPQLSYASYFDDPVKRTVVRFDERLSGQPRLQNMYETYRRDLADQPFFDAAISLLKLNVQFGFFLL